jgi:hypothetical protein
LLQKGLDPGKLPFQLTGSYPDGTGEVFHINVSLGPTSMGLGPFVVGALEKVV